MTNEEGAMLKTGTREVAKIAPAYETLEGDGVMIGRALPSREVDLTEVDPFLLLDHAALQPGGPAFPRHSHRGFELIFYLLDTWEPRKVQESLYSGGPGASRAGLCSGTGGRLLRRAGDTKAHQKKAESFAEGVEEVHAVSAIKHNVGPSRLMYALARM